jgi:hypothetical protein
MPTTSINSATTVNVPGSYWLTPNSSVAITRTSAAAGTKPMPERRLQSFDDDDAAPELLPHRRSEIFRFIRTPMLRR